MANIKTYIKTHPVLSYFILTYVISWGGVLILGAPYGMPTTKEQFEKLWPIVFFPYLLGPSISGILLTGFVYGKNGFRELLSRLLSWRVNPLWYVFSILTIPFLAIVILFALSFISPSFLPKIFTSDDWSTVLFTGIAVGIFGGGLLEEPGWTGFAVPGLRRQYGFFTTGLIVGLLWGGWHFLPTYWGSGDSFGVLSFSLLLPPCFFYIGVLPAYRILMVWVYDRTKSLFIAILMHASLTASAIFILAPSVEGMPLFAYYLILTAVLWGIVVVVYRRQKVQF